MTTFQFYVFNDLLTPLKKTAKSNETILRNDYCGRTNGRTSIQRTLPQTRDQKIKHKKQSL